MSPLTKYATRALAIFYFQELSTLTTNNSTVSTHLGAVLQYQALTLNIHVLYIEREKDIETEFKIYFIFIYIIYVNSFIYV